MRKKIEVELWVYITLLIGAVLSIVNYVRGVL